MKFQVGDEEKMIFLEDSDQPITKEQEQWRTHIDEMWAVLVIDEKGCEQIYAMDTASIYGINGPSMMQAVTSNPKIAENIDQFCKKNFPKKDFKIVKFRRSE